jgi:hypothetical protein
MLYPIELRVQLRVMKRICFLRELQTILLKKQKRRKSREMLWSRSRISRAQDAFQTFN